MSKMKTQFELVNCNDVGTRNMIKIIGRNDGLHIPYVAIETDQSDDPVNQLFIQDKDLERFAVNILKALKSKKLK